MPNPKIGLPGFREVFRKIIHLTEDPPRFAAGASSGPYAPFGLEPVMGIELDLVAPPQLFGSRGETGRKENRSCDQQQKDFRKVSDSVHLIRMDLAAILKPVTDASQENVGIPVVVRDDPVPGGSQEPVFTDSEAPRHRSHLTEKSIRVSSLFMTASALIDGEIPAETGAE